MPDSSGNEQYVGVNPAVVPLLSLWPVANGPELGHGIAEAFSNPPQHIREDFGTARFDYNLASKDQLFAVYTVDDSSADTPSQNPLSRVNEGLREQVASIQEQHVFSQALLNTARFGFSRASYFFTGYSPVSVAGWVTGKPVGAIVISGSTASNGASQITQAGVYLIPPWALRCRTSPGSISAWRSFRSICCRICSSRWRRGSPPNLNRPVHGAGARALPVGAQRVRRSLFGDRHAPAHSSRRRSSRPISPNWARRCARSRPQAPTGSMST